MYMFGGDGEDDDSRQSAAAATASLNWRPANFRAEASLRGTISSDEDDEEPVPPQPRRTPIFAVADSEDTWMPAAAAVSARQSDKSRAQSEHLPPNPAAAPLQPQPQRARTGASVTVPGISAQFRPDRAGWVQRTYLPPYVAPAVDIGSVRDFITWRRKEIADLKKMHSQPWYQFAELVSGLSGIRLDKIIYFSPSNGLAETRPTPAPDAGLRTEEHAALLNAGGVQDDTPVDRQAYMERDLDLALGGPANAVIAAPESGHDLASRYETSRMAQWLGGARVTGTVFFAPMYTANRAAAVARVHTIPGLRNVAEDTLMTLPETRVWFATIVASLMNVSQFVEGRAPLRAGDYDKYVDRIDDAMIQLRRLRLSVADATRQQPRWSPYDSAERQTRTVLDDVRKLTLSLPGYSARP